MYSSLNFKSYFFARAFHGPFFNGVIIVKMVLKLLGAKLVTGPNLGVVF